MNLPNHDNLLQVIGELRQYYPHWRFGQLVANVASWTNVNVWDIDDDKLLNAAQTHLKRLAKHQRINT